MFKKIRVWLIKKLGGVVLATDETVVSKSFLLTKSSLLNGLYTPEFISMLKDAKIKENHWQKIVFVCKIKNDDLDLHGVFLDLNQLENENLFINLNNLCSN